MVYDRIFCSIQFLKYPTLAKTVKASLMSHLGDPQDRFKSILIAGTNGKGSVAAILSNILMKNALKTGLYTSPHLISVTERLKINNLAL